MSFAILLFSYFAAKTLEKTIDTSSLIVAAFCSEFHKGDTSSCAVTESSGLFSWLNFDQVAKNLYLKSKISHSISISVSYRSDDLGPLSPDVDDFFYGMVHRPKALSLISSWDHCQRSSLLRTSDMPQAEFGLALNLSSLALMNEVVQ